MRIDCFGCDAEIEADDVDAVVDRFLTHGRESHDWSYPEQALRNYALNWAEAIGRLHGELDRRDRIGEVVIRPVDDANIADWLGFFDHEAFTDNPDWASCYCLEPHVPPTPELPERYWRDSRAMMVERFESGQTFGYLAEVDDKAAGWVNASRRSDYAAYRRDTPEDESVIGIACFVVAPPFRSHGIAGLLLDRVISDAPGRGASSIEAYPISDPERAEESHYFRGPKAMYESRGFDEVELRKHISVMRLGLTE
ncbi:MAG TPA: GNAT family N-acetyltransferase [Acidimicrobiia bacterium]|nr:GNAT family N-acetyltransferase [Acidimicrobiia bacterium]